MDHQRVLVVSEKLADLNGIQKQLEQCQLSHLVLPYFGHQVQSQHLSHAIKKALQTDKIADSDLVQPLSIESIQQKIHHYETCVNSPIGQTNFNFKQAVGFLTRYAQILKENQVELEPLQVGALDLTRWDTAHYLQASEKIDLFIQYLDQHGTPADNAFVSTQLCELDESHWNDIKQCIEKIIETSQVQWQVADEFRESLGLHQENRTLGTFNAVFKHCNICKNARSHGH